MSEIASAPSSRSLWRFVFAGGAVAALVIVGVVSSRSPSISDTPISDNAIGANPISNHPIINPTAQAVAPSPHTSMVQTVASPDGGESALAVFEQEAGITVAALERPELLAPVKPLLEGAPIKAIDIEPIRVAPLVVPAIDDNNQR